MFHYSIVATTFNDSAEIGRYLENICMQTALPDEIVIADGGSTDDTIEKIRNYRSNCVVPIKIVQKGRLNISQGYNEAIKKSETDFIGITGVGNVYDQRYFEHLINKLEKNASDIVYSPIRGTNRTTFSKRYNNAFLGGEKGFKAEIASNHGALVKKNVFKELDFFYEDFVYAGEDTEFYLLAKNKGYKISLALDAKVYWETPKTFKEFKKQVRVYTIASLQINSKKQWKVIARNATKLFMLLLLLISLIVCCGLNIAWGYKLLFLGFFVLMAIVFKDKINFLRILRMIFSVYYSLKFHKYMGEKYTVKRE